MPIWRKQPPPRESGQTLSDITRGFQHAVNATQELLEQSQIRTLERFFHEDGSPVVMPIKLDDDTTINAPLIAMVPHNSLGVEELEVDFQVYVQGSKLKSILDPSGKNTLDRSTLGVDFQSSNHNGRSDNKIGVKMKFKSRDTTEGISRIKDEFIKRLLNPAPKDDGNK